MKRTLLLAAGMTLSVAALAAPAGKKVAAAQGQGPDWQEPATGMAFREIPKGCFRMGAETPQVPQPEFFWDRAGYTKTASEDERPVHEVCVDGFWVGKYEIRRSEWRQVMAEAPKDDAKDGDLPMTGINWEQAEEFARRLSGLSAGKYRFRLPTEAEWEYACRAGSAKDIDPLANDVARFAWHLLSHTSTQPVGQLQPNAWGLHDMLGNAWEWVADGYAADAYARHDLYNPRMKAGPGQKDWKGQKVLRGGSFRTETVQVRCAMRGHHDPQVGSDAIGLRLVRER
jgi:formylglycine-generating enzyme required for sulfatase activity